MAGDNVRIIRKSVPQIVPMYNMKHGQIGIVTDSSSYSKTVVKAFNHPHLANTIHVFALDGSDSYWKSESPGKGGGVDVEIIEPGSTVEIVVPSRYL
jgi:hypothetical protein